MVGPQTYKSAPGRARSSAEAIGEAPSTYDVAALIGAVKRNGFGLVAWIAICLMGAGIVICITPPEYAASTQIIFRAAAKKRTPADLDKMPNTIDSALADSRLQVIKSERLLRFVFDSLKLEAAESASATPSLPRRLLNLVLPAPTPTPEQRYTTALVAFMNKVAVKRVGLSYVAEISFRAPSAQQAAHVANSIAAAYIRDAILSGERDGEMLEQRIADIKEEDGRLLAAIDKGEIPDADFPDADARVISAALVPVAKASPQVTLTLAFALVFSLVTGLAVIIARHNADRTMRTRREAQKALGVRCIAAVPGPEKARPFRKAVCELTRGGARPDQRAALSQVMADIVSPTSLDGHRAIGLVSWARGEGTSWVAYNLSLLLGECREHVVLVDGNSGRPALSRLLAPGEAGGLSQSLAHHDPVQVLPHLSVAKGVRFMPRGLVDADNNPLLFPKWKMQLIIEELKTYGHVLLDLPPLNNTSDVLNIGSHLDGVILVVEAGRRPVDDVRDALQMLEAAGVTVFGIILNKTDAPQAPRATGQPGRQAAPQRFGLPEMQDARIPMN